jgi:GT2 family glycosyltransferase
VSEQQKPPPRPPRAGAPTVTVAVLSYDGRHLLEKALPSIAAQSHPDLDVLVVDNGSSDGTAAWLASAWPGVRVFALPSNVGVTAALNVCAGAAEGELVMLLNNDVELEPDCVERLVAALDEHPEAGSASPKLLDFHDRGVLDGAGDEFTWTGSPRRRGHGERDRGQYDADQEIFGACGGAAIYRAEALKRVGPFDEDFFAYYEDSDWSLRAQVAGLGCRYVPAAVVYHMGSATLGREMTDFTRYHLWRNSVWMLAKCLPGGVALRHAPQLLYGQLWNLAMAVRDRRLGLLARAWRDALRGLPRMFAKRRQVQALRPEGRHALEGRIAAS